MGIHNISHYSVGQHFCNFPILLYFPCLIGCVRLDGFLVVHQAMWICGLCSLYVFNMNSGKIWLLWWNLVSSFLVELKTWRGIQAIHEPHGLKPKKLEVVRNFPPLFLRGDRKYCFFSLETFSGNFFFWNFSNIPLGKQTNKQTTKPLFWVMSNHIAINKMSKHFSLWHSWNVTFHVCATSHYLPMLKPCLMGGVLWGLICPLFLMNQAPCLHYIFHRLATRKRGEDVTQLSIPWVFWERKVPFSMF